MKHAAEPAILCEMPSLLDLLEAREVNMAAVWGYEAGVASDESGITACPGKSLQELSLCTDEGADDTIRSYVTQTSLAELSVCADEGSDQSNPTAPLSDLSLCADEANGPSDVRLKADVEQVGTTVYGLPLFHFRYKDGSERFEGVMAQDVLQVMPDAVSVSGDGYYRVNYARLGIRMTRV